MKEIEEIQRVISEIENIDLNNLYAYSTIEQIIKNDLIQVALPSKIFEPGLKLHRCCINDDENDFKTVDRISFRTDLENITEFGRANMPNQSIFYSADVLPTAFLETSMVFRGENYKNIETISITTGHWESTEKLKFALFIGNKNAQEKNELIRGLNTDVYNYTFKLFKEDSEKILKILDFISNEFTINTEGNSNLYKISCAFAQLAYLTADGIIYPSLQRRFEGLNFAIKPEVVTRKLRLVSATHDKFIKFGGKEYKHRERNETIRIDGNKLVW